MLTTLSALAMEQAKLTMMMMKKTKQFLDYAASNSNATLTYKASNMVIMVHSNAPYLNEQKAHSRVGGFFFLSTADVFPSNNGMVLNTMQVIKAVMSLAAEANSGALFLSAKQAAPM